MDRIESQWNNREAVSNDKKHGISFDEAKTVFFDENAKIISDPDHSSDEERFVIVGLSASARLLVVCHCYRKNEGIFV